MPIRGCREKIDHGVYEEKSLEPPQPLLLCALCVLCGDSWVAPAEAIAITGTGDNTLTLSIDDLLDISETPSLDRDGNSRSGWPE